MSSTPHEVEPNTEPLVSVIMIFLNSELYLEEAIQSVLDQTYGNWELLLVDDGSTDGSTALAKAYADKHAPKIRYFEHQGHVNKGTGPSRNLGLAIANGDYVAFLDADDVYEPERVARHVQVLQENPNAGIVIGSELYWYSWKQQNSEHSPTLLEHDYELGPGVTPNVIFDPPILLALMTAPNRAATPAPCSITFRRLDSDGLSGIPSHFVSQYEDQALIAKLLLSRSSIVILDCLAKYRQHALSLTARARQRGEYGIAGAMEAERTYLHWLRQYAQDLGIADRSLDRALAKRLFKYEHPVASTLRHGPILFFRRIADGLLTVSAILHPELSRERLSNRWQKLKWHWRKRKIRQDELDLKVACRLRKLTEADR